VNAVLTGLVACLPAIYLYSIWPHVPALVATHFGADNIPDHFTSRQHLWNVVWWPAIAFLVLTFLPQVHERQSLFWSSYHQRQLRWLVVGGGALWLTIILRYNIENGKDLPNRPGISVRVKAK
jgi:hypothetical protein